jgi:hypothetical protein
MPRQQKWELNAIAAFLQIELRRVTYKPAWEFHVEVVGQALILRACCRPPNADDPGQTAHISLSRELPVAMFTDLDASEGPFFAHVFELIVEIEMHEVYEFLKVDGKHYQAPHPVGAR